MRKHFTKFLALATVAVTAAVFTGCSSEETPIADFNGDANAPMSRAAHSQVVIDFDNLISFAAGDALAGPTSYGANYYYGFGDDQVQGIMDMDAFFVAPENEGAWPVGSSVNPSFMFGGIAVSDWAMISNPSSNPNPGKPFTSEWWMSEYNQMSVYNTARTATGNRGGAGAGGSDNFGVVYGYDDSFGYTKEASFTLSDAKTLKSLKICNTAYTYGVIQNGNEWNGEGGVVVTAESLVKTKGYLTLIIKCYDGSDNLVKRVETPLADYQNGKNFCVTTWTEVPINAANVAKVQFGFWGSDVKSGGLCTPAYVAIDDIVLE